jgi:hypothetical protein
MMEGEGFIETGFREFGGGIMAINFGTRPRGEGRRRNPEVRI